MLTPELHFGINDVRKWKGKHPNDVWKILKPMLDGMKRAVDYPYDNTHLYIRDTRGGVVLQVLFVPSCDSIEFWNAKTHTALKDGIRDKITKADITYVTDAMWHITQGQTMCTVCGEWVDAYKNFSYAGAVCVGCYDPDKHKGPDTSGN